MARTRAVLAGVHAAMTSAGIALPLESRTVVSDENRLQKGIAVQTEIFGEQITRIHQTTPAERRSLMIFPVGVSAISIPAKVLPKRAVKPRHS